MDKREYLSLVTEQIRCKKARPMVEQELEDHIEDQQAAYEESGLSKEEALSEAVAQMGDPVEVGTAMDRIHRKRVDYRSLTLIAVLILEGVLLQIGMGQDPASVCINAILQYVVMAAVMFLDYSILAKHPVGVWIVSMVVLALWSGVFDQFWFSQPGTYGTNVHVLHVILLLLYAALVYAYREKGVRGILACLGWLMLGSFLLSRLYVSLMAACCFFITSIITLSFAVHKGWFGEKGKGWQLLVWGIWSVPAAVAVAALYMGWIGRAYEIDRVRSFLHPATDVAGNNYVLNTMRKSLSELKLFSGTLQGEPFEGWYSFSYILERFGIAAGVLVVVILSVLLGKMLSKMIKQKNRLGVLIGVSCMGFLLMTTVLHVCVSLTILPATSAYLPFLTNDRSGSIASGLLFGMYLSVYRNDPVLCLDKKNRCAIMSVSKPEEG